MLVHMNVTRARWLPFNCSLHDQLTSDPDSAGEPEDDQGSEECHQIPTLRDDEAGSGEQSEGGALQRVLVHPLHHVPGDHGPHEKREAPADGGAFSYHSAEMDHEKLQNCLLERFFKT